MSSLAINKVVHLITPNKSPIIRNCSTPSRVARCLFSPRKTETNVTAFQCVTPVRPKLNQQLEIPSFDTPSHTLLSPDSLDKKVKGFVLGRGSYGLVVKGRYKNEKVAVKIISKEHNTVHCSLPREMNALQLNHPNIIQVFKVVRSINVNTGFVFMELYNHANLENILQDQVIPLKIKLRFLKEIASALEHCHSKCILHLDVKPKNIIVSSLDNTCKLCDFGNSKNIADSTSGSPTKGTLKYTAPELLRGKTATEKADSYSYGITMWQIIHQLVPYDKENLHAVVYKVVTEDYRPESIGKECNVQISHIYKACWDAEPSKRPSMSQIIPMFQEITKP